MDFMAHKLYIPPCIDTPAHSLHLPPLGRPLRIQIEGPLTCIEKLFPDVSWQLEHIPPRPFPQPAGLRLARLTCRELYGREAHPEDPEVVGNIVLRDEYLGWLQPVSLSKIDYYGVTFDYLVPADDPDPDVLQINMIEIEYDGGAYANETLRWGPIDAAEYIANKLVLAVPRCCQKRKGTQDRSRVNDSVAWRGAREIMDDDVTRRNE
ncbi:hypothetical protein L228DRAFT_249560 [Xylona heveae TC161]|uniref:Uncharacterized protein n=1 Tax=Xylona heveae (strain CBS 132557 / TC161) TaxID=1328760 RepID=A0A165F9Y1_XYLHT|nr:hypothetical protein L228DRAFT_249560 [Xylona heveae TC161]KZF20749.1 hypothetical protein L228DRAFT_249560 [Xylona heveae TC161]